LIAKTPYSRFSIIPHRGSLDDPTRVPQHFRDGLLCCRAQCPGAGFGGPLQIVKTLGSVSGGASQKLSWPIRPMTPITCAKPSPPKGALAVIPNRHRRSNIRSTSTSMPSVISSNAASQSSSNSAASQPASKRPPEITGPPSLSLPSPYGCDNCPRRLKHRASLALSWPATKSAPRHNAPYYYGALHRRLAPSAAKNVAGRFEAPRQNQSSRAPPFGGVVRADEVTRDLIYTIKLRRPRFGNRYWAWTLRVFDGMATGCMSCPL
jgi:hypothetical protein